MKQMAINVQHELNEEEINKKAKELAERIRNFGVIQEQKKSSNSRFKSELDRINEEIQKISIDIMLGYVNETKVCDVEDDMSRKVRIYTDPFTGEEVKRESLPDDYQPNIFENTDTVYNSDEFLDKLQKLEIIKPENDDE